MKEDGEQRRIAEHIFTGSTTMIGVCLTVITLFSIIKTGVTTYADEILGINTFIFIISAFISYSSLRKNNEPFREWIADIIFFIGMTIMVLAGLLIIFFP